MRHKGFWSKYNFSGSQPVEWAGSEAAGSYTGHYAKNVYNEAWYGFIFGGFGSHWLFGGKILFYIWKLNLLLYLPHTMALLLSRGKAHAG